MVVELGGVEIEPLREQRGVCLDIGQRVSAVVALDQAPGHHHIRAQADAAHGCRRGQRGQREPH